MFSLQRKRCRLCGISDYDITTIESNLSSKINTLFHIRINIENDEDKLPKGVCRKCISSVDVYWTFYQRVQIVQRVLTENDYIKNEAFSDEDDTLRHQRNRSPERVVRSRRQTNIKSRNKVKVNVSALHTPHTKDWLSKNLIKLEGEVKNSRSNLTKGNDVPSDPEETWSDYPWWCLTCQLNFTDVDAYNKHSCYKKHKRYFCIDCSKAFIIYNQLITHVKEFHWDRLKAHLLCQCDVCKLWFLSKEVQEIHRRQEHPDVEARGEIEMPVHYSFICKVCGKIYANRKTLRQHEFIHSDKLSHVCSTCGERFHFYAGLCCHRSKYHDEEMLHCDQCGKKFPTKALLLSHMVSHSKVRPFACDICNKTFKTKYMVKIHKSRHTDKKPHVCDTCGKSFKCRSNLTNHRYLHKKEKVHKCPICEKAFKSKTHLINHERQHTGEQPFSCPVCSKKFTYNGNRVKHMRRIHKNYPIEAISYEDKIEQIQKNDEMILESVNPVMY